MKVFLPDNLWMAGVLLVAIVLSIIAGFLLQRRAWDLTGRVAAWLLALGLPWLVERIFLDALSGFRMLAIITTLFFGMKAVVGVESRANAEPLRFSLWLIFSCFWPGMRPQIFNQVRHAMKNAGGMAASGLVRLLAGGAILVVAIALVRIMGSGGIWFWIECGLVLVGVSLVFHFGIITLMGSALRVAGYDCRPLFRAPLESRSLAEFWSRRWNVAFCEMTSLAVFRPVAKQFGSVYATMAAFACSGLFHEMAISWPVNNGYGLPMLYFLIQGGFILLERRSVFGLFVGRVVTVCVVVLPLPILFHVWFLRGIVFPLIQP